MGLEENNKCKDYDNQERGRRHHSRRQIQPMKNNNDDKEKDLTLGEGLCEVPIGKGLAGTLKLLEERGALGQTEEHGRRFTDKKRNSFAGGVDDDDDDRVDLSKEIRIERRDEFGRIMNPKEAFRVFSHKFHGKKPGKRAQEKRRKLHQEELRLNRLQNTNTPSLFMERMSELQVQSNTPYIVLHSCHSNS